MRSIRTVADPSALFESLGTLLSSHRAVTRVSLAALSFTLIVAFTQQAAPAIQAGPQPEPLVPESLLPQSVGSAIPSDESITIPFDAAVDPDMVEAALQVLPAQKFRTSWNDDGTELTISPERLWRTDERYLVVVGAAAGQSEAGQPDRPRRYSFTTQTAPAVTDFQARLAGPADDAGAETASDALAAEAADTGSSDPGTQPPDRTAQDVSATSEITISFSVPMDERDVEGHFLISPAIEGDL
ncbi:MAG TPA: Ig-like domain-containing protein, partial [Patescibacteria group bacterium]|nr:Ig-like domain-containing protein [Patescibacteria group bacterium]